MARVSIIIPARYGAVRFPGKPLADLGESPLFSMSTNGHGKHVAPIWYSSPPTTSGLLVRPRAFGAEVAMTRGDHPSGTDRVAEAAGGIVTDVVVNVQGDEPFIDPGDIDAAVAPLLADDTIPMGTLCSPLETTEELANPNVVKVVFDRSGKALYFSRLSHSLRARPRIAKPPAIATSASTSIERTSSSNWANSPRRRWSRRRSWSNFGCSNMATNPRHRRAPHVPGGRHSGGPRGCRRWGRSRADGRSASSSVRGHLTQTTCSYRIEAIGGARWPSRSIRPWLLKSFAASSPWRTRSESSSSARTRGRGGGGFRHRPAGRPTGVISRRQETLRLRGGPRTPRRLRGRPSLQPGRPCKMERGA